MYPLVLRNHLASPGCSSFHLYTQSCLPALPSWFDTLPYLDLILISFPGSPVVPFSVGLKLAISYFYYKNPVPQGFCLFRRGSENRERIERRSPGNGLDKHSSYKSMSWAHGSSGLSYAIQRLTCGSTENAKPLLSLSAPLCAVGYFDLAPLSRCAQEIR